MVPSDAAYVCESVGLGRYSIEKLKEIMDHGSVVVTEGYAHLKPELFRAADYELLNVDLASEGQVVQLEPKNAESGAGSYVAATVAESMR